MLNKKMLSLGSNQSVIRKISDIAKQRVAESGPDSIFDFSIGNPHAPVPETVKAALTDAICGGDQLGVHGYTSEPGNESLRKRLAEDINRIYGVETRAKHIYLTCGAAAGLAITLKAICNAGDEVILVAPYFPEYAIYVESADATPIVVRCANDFSLDLNAIEAAVTERTKAILVNSPNNPTGAIYTQRQIDDLSTLLRRRSKQYSHPIYAISDEPYRELVYDGRDVPSLFGRYDNTLLCYSFSKSLSLPGERIGYIAISPSIMDENDVYAVIDGAARALGYICAPSLFQRVIEGCLPARPDMDFYGNNRRLIYDALTSIGYECAPPEGAFYLFIRALESDAIAFCTRAAKLGILLVPGDEFSLPGYVRLAYCVSPQIIANSIPVFKKLYDSYNV